jgi:hypothetical protein
MRISEEKNIGGFLELQESKIQPGSMGIMKKISQKPKCSNTVSEQRLFSKRYNMRIWITTFELFLKLSRCSWAFRERERGGVLDSFIKSN